jgi:CTP synthase
MAVVEFARNVAGLRSANSTEFDKECPAPVIDLMPEQQLHQGRKGGTMRLGAYPCLLKEGSLAHRLYGVQAISERHRHRYEVNNIYRRTLEDKGLVFSGLYVEKDLVEIIELPDHPWFIGVQFHPEFKSKPLAPHPIFRGFVRAAVCQKNRTSPVTVKEPAQSEAR